MLNSQGTALTLTARTGSIQVAGNTSFAGGTIRLDAANDITVGGSMTCQNTVLNMTARNGSIRTAGNAGFTGGTADLDAMLNVILGGMLNSQGTGLTLTARTGSIQVAKDAIFGNCTADMDAGMDITLKNRLTADASDMDMTAHTGSIGILERTVLTEASRLMLKAARDIAGGEILMNASNLTADAGGHILTDTMEASESVITLLAGGNITLKNNNSYICYRDADKTADERLTLRAGGNIGSADRPVLLDMEETLYILAAMDYFIRAEALVPDPNLDPGMDVLFHRVIKQDVLQSGIDADGSLVSGEYLANGTPLTEQINASLAIQTNDEIAQWLAGRMDRAQAASVLDRDALARLISSGVLTKPALVALLSGDDRNIKKQVNTIFEQPDAAQTLADMLIGKMKEQANGAYSMDTNQLAQVYMGAMNGGELQPANLIAGLLRADEIEALLKMHGNWRHSWTITENWTRLSAYAK
jgi:hypothetical protein